MNDILIAVLKLYGFTVITSNVLTIACFTRMAFNYGRKYKVVPYMKKYLKGIALNILFKKFIKSLIPINNIIMSSLEWFYPDILDVTLGDYLLQKGIIIGKNVDIVSLNENFVKKDHEDISVKSIPKRIINKVKKRVRTKNDKNWQSFAFMI